MSKKTVRMLAVCLLCTACAMLAGCGVRIDEGILTAQADYDIDIALPYATARPAVVEQEAPEALVIDAEGGVTVNDPASILQDEVAQSADSDTNYNSLRQGNTGLAVQALQMRLQELGYYNAGISGVFDANTESAVRRFEQTYGTMQTGVATAELQTRLFASDALVYGSEEYNSAVISQYRELQRGDVGSAVYALQQRLRNLNYPIADLTGTFDNATANAIMLFYEAYGLSASDVASVALQRELYSDTARAYGNASVDSASDALTMLSPETVAQIQRRLIDLGYLTGAITGEQDAATQLAIKLFEEACGQLPSGSLSDSILNLLQSSRAPRFETLASQYSNLIEGSSGDEVLRLQERLVELGFATGTPNGQYGAATSASIRLFQTANGMEETGVGSTYLQAVLYSSFALNINGETIGAARPLATEEPEKAEVIEDLESFEETEVGEQDADDEYDDVPSTPLTALIVGSSGDDVLRLQNRLTELGYVTSITGTYDDLTRRAVLSFQEAVGVEADGSASTDLLGLMYSDIAPHNGFSFADLEQNYRRLEPGDEGDDVILLQRRLYELNLLVREDVEDSIGTYNEGTRRAVAALQSAVGYETPDGIASAELQYFLHSDYSDRLK